MVNGISAASNVAQTNFSPAPAKGTPAPKAGSAPQDSAQLSSTAMKLLSAKTPEALETPAQTEAEAASGDPMALAKLAAQKIQ
jgi:hypothetical protein